MVFKTFRDFAGQLDHAGELKRIFQAVIRVNN
jgi:hypothetical protein